MSEQHPRVEEILAREKVLADLRVHELEVELDGVARLRAVNAKLVAALERVTHHQEQALDYIKGAHSWEELVRELTQRLVTAGEQAREAIEEVNK